MQKSSQPQLAAGPMSGQVAPTVCGPDKDRTELYLAVGVLAILGLGISAVWLSSRSTESEPTSPVIAKRDMTFGSPIQPAPAEAKPSAPAPLMSRSVLQPVASTEGEVKHVDLYFEIGRKGLTDDAKAQLQIHAELLKSNPNWGVLLQGYTDQQGSADYNKKLGLRRAEAVKETLVSLGAPETSIKIMSLGKDGALCADTSDTCNSLNRRVHMEFRNLGAEHMGPTTTSLKTSSDRPETAEASSESPAVPQQTLKSNPEQTSGTAPEVSPTSEPVVGQK